MKRHRRYLVFLLAVTLLAGCWNRRELETLGIIVGVGYDWDPETEEYIVTAQMARPAALHLEGGGGARTHVFSARGKTVFDASRNMSLVATRKIWWGHVQVVVVGEEAAKQGLVGALNFMQRDGETRGIYWILVTQGRAADILRAKASPEDIPAMGLNSLMRTAGATSYAPATRLLDTLRNLEAPSAFLIGLIRLTEEQGAIGGLPTREFRLDGSAVFVRDALAGYLNRTETRGVLWLRSKVRSGIITVMCPGQPDKYVGVEIIHTFTRMAPYVDPQGRPGVRALVRMEGNIGDQDCLNRFDQLDPLAELERRVKAAVRAEIALGLEACKELKADCAGVGVRFQQELPRVWKQLEKRWPEPMEDMRFTVETDVKVRGTGAELRPPRPK